MFWRLAFWEPALVTAEFLDARLKLAHLSGAHATFLKALRSGLGLRGFPDGRRRGSAGRAPVGEGAS
jgi:hypothetical protein